jgi:hypothetical protein
MSGIVLHTSTSTTHASNLAKTLDYYACELPLGQGSLPVLWGIEIAILMLEPNFLKKEVENDPLLDDILAKSTDENFHIVPVLLAECAWEESMYNGLKFLPKSKVAILSNPDVHDHMQSMKAIADEILALEKSMLLKKNNPIAYKKQQKKLAKKEEGPNFWVLATKLGWRVLPNRTKWLVRLGLGGGLAAISYLIFG